MALSATNLSAAQREQVLSYIATQTPLATLTAEQVKACTIDERRLLVKAGLISEEQLETGTEVILNEEKKESILNNEILTAQEKDIILSKFGVTNANIKEASSWKILGARIKESMLAFATNPATWVIAGIAVAHTLVEAFNDSTQEIEERLEETRNTIQETDSEISSITQKIEANTQKLEEMRAAGMDESALQTYVLENEELERQKQLLIDINEESKKKIAPDVAKLVNNEGKQTTFGRAFDKLKSGDIGGYLGDTAIGHLFSGEYFKDGGKEKLANDIRGLQNPLHNFIVPVTDPDEDIIARTNSALDKYKKYKEELENLNEEDFKSKEAFWNKQQELNGKIGEVSSTIGTNISTLIGYREKLAKSDGANTYYADEIKKIDDIIKGYYSANPESAFDYVFSQESFADVKKKLDDFSKSGLGELRTGIQDLIPVNGELYNKLVDFGLITKDNANWVDELAIKFDFLSHSTNGVDENVDKMTVSLSDLKSASDGLKILGNAFKEMDDDGRVSLDTLESIKSTFGDSVDDIDDYIDRLVKAKSNSKDFNDVLTDLTYGYINQKMSTEQLANANEAYIATLLDEVGVSNSVEVAQHMIAVAKEKVRLETEGISNKTEEEIIALANEEGQTYVTRQALIELARKKVELNATKIDTDSDVQEILNIAKAAGIGMQALEMLEKAKSYLSPAFVGPVPEDIQQTINDLKNGNFDWNWDTSDLPDVRYTNKSSKDVAKEHAKKQEEYAEKIIDIQENLADARADYAEKVADINEDLAEKEQQFVEDMAEAWKEEHLEQLKDSLEERKDIINRYKEDIDISDFGLDLIGEDDFTNRSDLLTNKLDQLTNYGMAMRQEFERVANIIPQTADEAQELANRLTELGDDMRNNVSTIRETKVAIMRLRVDTFASMADTHMSELERELDNIGRRIEILTSDDKDEYKYTNKVLSMSSLLPTYSDFSKQRKEKERQDKELIQLEQTTQNTINDVVSRALEMQSKENAAAREKERQNLIRDMEKARQDAAEKLAEANKDLQEAIKEAGEQLNEATEDYREFLEENEIATDETIGYVENAIAEANLVFPKPDISQVKQAVDEIIRETGRAKSAVDELSSSGGSNGIENEDKLENKDDNASFIFNYLKQKGFSNEGIVAIMGNLAQESGLNPNAVNKSSGAFGIAQWLGNRKKQLFKKYGDNPTLQQQLDFLVYEILNDPYENSMSGYIVNNPNNLTVDQLTVKFRKTYERPGESEANDTRRKTYAQKYYERFVKHAKGTPFHPGGLAMVGDENWLKGSNKPAPELAIYPDGTSEVLGKDGVEIRDLPRGTQVIPAKPTKELLGIPNYANGTSDFGFDLLLRSLKESESRAMSDAQLALGSAQMKGEPFDQTAYFENLTWSFQFGDKDIWINGFRNLQHIRSLIENLIGINKTELKNADDYIDLLSRLSPDSVYKGLIAQKEEFNNQAAESGEFVFIDDSAIDEYLWNEFYENSPLNEDLNVLKSINKYITGNLNNVDKGVIDYYKSLSTQGVEAQRSVEDAKIVYSDLLNEAILDPSKTTEDIIADMLDPSTPLGGAYKNFLDASAIRDSLYYDLEDSWNNREWIIGQKIAEENENLSNMGGYHMPLVFGGGSMTEEYDDFLHDTKDNGYVQNAIMSELYQDEDGNWLLPSDSRYIGSWMESKAKEAHLNGREIPQWGGWQRVVISDNGTKVPYEQWTGTWYPKEVTWEPIEGYEGWYGDKNNNMFITKDGQIIQRGQFATTFYDKDDYTSAEVVLNDDATDRIVDMFSKEVADEILSISYSNAEKAYYVDLESKQNSTSSSSGTSSGYEEELDPEIKKINEMFDEFEKGWNKILLDARLEAERIGDNQPIQLYRLADSISERGAEQGYKVYEQINAMFKDYLKRTEENPEDYDQEVVDAYLEALDTIAENIESLETEAINQRKALVETYQNRALDVLELESSRIGSLKSLQQSYFDTINSISNARHEIDKELSASKAMYEWLDEETRQLLFNQEDYNVLSKKLTGIQREANALQKEFNDKLLNATEENLAQITAEYEMQYSLLMKNYEIAKADLEVAKKKQQLNNVLNERNVRMFINGSWQWVANTQDVIDAQNELAEAEYNVHQAKTELSQTKNLNQLTQAENLIGTAMNYIKKGSNEFGYELNKINGLLSGVSTISIPALDDIIKSAGKSIMSFISSLTTIYYGSIYDSVKGGDGTDSKDNIVYRGNGSTYYKENFVGKNPVVDKFLEDQEIEGDFNLIVDPDVDEFLREQEIEGSYILYGSGTRYTKSGKSLIGEKEPEMYIDNVGHLIPINQPTLGNIGAGGIVFNQSQMTNLRDWWDLSNLAAPSTSFVKNIPMQSESFVFSGDINVYNPADSKEVADNVVNHIVQGLKLQRKSR